MGVVVARVCEGVKRISPGLRVAMMALRTRGDACGPVVVEGGIAVATRGEAVLSTLTGSA